MKKPYLLLPLVMLLIAGAASAQNTAMSGFVVTQDVFSDTIQPSPFLPDGTLEAVHDGLMPPGISRQWLEVTTNSGGEPYNKQAVMQTMPYWVWNNYYRWLVNDDTVRYTTYHLSDYVCVNYTIDSLNAAFDQGYWPLYAEWIQNFEGLGNHFVIAVKVTGKGKIYYDTSFHMKENPNPSGFTIMVDPQNEEILNHVLANDNITEKITIITPQGFRTTDWADDGSLGFDISPSYVVGKGTI